MYARWVLKVLMLENDVHDAELIKNELFKGGFPIRAQRVETQETFADALARDPPDIILSDHGLPAFNGFEALTVAKQRCPDVPFVFVTGLAGGEKEFERFAREAVDYVLKSQLFNLVPVVQRALSKARKQSQHQNQKMEADGKLHLFSLYVDFAASVHARWAVGTITKLAGPCWKTSTEMWNLDSLNASQAVRKLTIQEAADADVLIVALSSLDRRESKLIEWLDALVAGKSEHPVSRLLIGLLGDEEHEAGELEWTVKQFMRCAQKMGRDFIWHWIGRGAINDTTWLDDSVEKFLSRKQSLFNMAWLQEPAVSVG